MRISELLKRDGMTFSLEVFPPKTSEKYSETVATAKKIAALQPDFMSVITLANKRRQSFLCVL